MHGAVRVEAGARGNADADAVRLQLLATREGRERELVLGERQRAHLRVLEHIGGHLTHEFRLAQLLLADRGVTRDHVTHFVGEHRGEFRRVVGKREQPARDVELPVGEREGVDRRRVEDRHLVAQVRLLGRRDQPLDRVADQRFEPRVVIGAAVGGEDALVLA